MREVRLCFGRSQLRLPKKSCFKDGQLAVSIRGPTKQLSSDLTNIFYPACDKLTRSFKSTPDCRHIFKPKRQSESGARIHKRLGKDAREAQLLESVVDARLGCCLCSSSQSLHNAQAPSISKQVVAAAHLRPGQYRPQIVGTPKKVEGYSRCLSLELRDGAARLGWPDPRPRMRSGVRQARPAHTSP